MSRIVMTFLDTLIFQVYIKIQFSSAMKDFVGIFVEIDPISISLIWRELTSLWYC